MFEVAVIGLRWLQMLGAMVLFGSSLFFIYALPKLGVGSAAAVRWPRPLLLASAAVVLIACILGFLAQTAVLAGSIVDALQPDALSAAATDMSFGKSSIVRAVAALFFLIAFTFMKPGRLGWSIAAVTGGLICASFAWMGHGAATPGAAGLLHTASDVVHTLAAGVWVGALVVFLILLVTDGSQPPEARRSLHLALHTFSGVGVALVAVLVTTGLINSWFVIGLAGLPRVLSTPYGQLLTLKIALFVCMLALAAANRFHHTPRLRQALQGASPPLVAVAALRRSLVWETGLAIAVIALVAWFGTLAPPSVVAI
jgi:putative copper resistance protein D